VTDVEVSRDLAYAKVFVTFVGEKSEKETDEAIGALNGAAGYLRKLLASSIKMRKTPQLAFLFDESGRRGQHLTALIDYAVSFQQNEGNASKGDSLDSKGR
jgi:ribosome-binding factor A